VACSVNAVIDLSYVCLPLDIEMQLVLDAKKPKSPRMFFLSEESRNVLNHSLTLDKNAQSCKTFNVYLKVNGVLYIFRS